MELNIKQHYPGTNKCDEARKKCDERQFDVISLQAMGKRSLVGSMPKVVEQGLKL